MCHNIIAFHSVLIASMVKPVSKTMKTTQPRPHSLAKASTTGKKRSASSKNMATPISSKQKRSRGSSSKATNLVAASNEKGTDSIVDQAVDIVLAGVQNHSFFISGRIAR